MHANCTIIHTICAIIVLSLFSSVSASTVHWMKASVALEALAFWGDDTKYILPIGMGRSSRIHFTYQRCCWSLAFPKPLIKSMKDKLSSARAEITILWSDTVCANVLVASICAKVVVSIVVNAFSRRPRSAPQFHGGSRGPRALTCVWR
ncbi:hypothetical protein B0H11DRAFT_1238276 [Mycena galericulata]|nr:hypothetical protein B0H11DRAFT_1238276 [Mycena galericulata]